MKSFKRLPMMNKIFIAMIVFILGAGYILYNQYNKLEYVDLSHFSPYESEYNSNNNKIQDMKNKLQYLIDLEKKFENKYVNKNDVRYLLDSINSALVNLSLIDGYTIDNVSYDPQYINVVHVQIRLYNIEDVEIVKTVLQYFFNNVMDKSILKLKSIDIDPNDTVIYLTLYK